MCEEKRVIVFFPFFAEKYGPYVPCLHKGSSKAGAILTGILSPQAITFRYRWQHKIVGFRLSLKLQRVQSLLGEKNKKTLFLLEVVCSFSSPLGGRISEVHVYI